MKYLLTLLFVSSLGYSIHCYPGLYKVATDMAMDKIKSEMPTWKMIATNAFDAVCETAKYYGDKAIESSTKAAKQGLNKGCEFIAKACKKGYNGIADECENHYNGVVADCKESIQRCKYKAVCFGHKITSVDSLYAMAFPQESDTLKHVKDVVLPGDIYDIKYEIYYHGHCLYAHSRSLGKPRINGGSIHYTLPTGQEYHFTLQDGDGMIKLKSSELIKS